MDSPRRQRSISLCQPHSTTPHPSRVGVPTLLPDALGCRPSTAGGQGASLSTFPLVPLTREPTCTRAIDPGISRSTLGPADTSRPSRSTGHFCDFPWSGSPWLAHDSPLHGDWFSNPMGLLLGAFGLPAHPMSHSPVPHPSTGPFPASHGLPTSSGRCAALATLPSPPPPLVPSSRVYTPAGRLQPCGAGPLDPLPSGDRLVRLARVAPFPPPSLFPVPRPRPNPLGSCAAPSHPSSRVYTPLGHQQPCGAGRLDPHPSGDRFVRLARVAPFPPFSPVPRPRPNPLGCCVAPSRPASRVYTPRGHQQPCGAGRLDPHPSGDRFVRLAWVAPFPPFSPVPRPRPNPLGCCVAPSHPSSRVYTPRGRQQPCGAGQLDPHPSGDRFVRLARVAPFPPSSPVPRPRPNPLGCCVAPSRPASRVYTPRGRQQPCGAGRLDPHPSGDRFVRLAWVAPLPPPPLTPVPPPMLS